MLLFSSLIAVDSTAREASERRSFSQNNGDVSLNKPKETMHVRYKYNDQPNNNITTRRDLMRHRLFFVTVGIRVSSFASMVSASARHSSFLEAYFGPPSDPIDISHFLDAHTELPTLEDVTAEEDFQYVPSSSVDAC